MGLLLTRYARPHTKFPTVPRRIAGKIEDLDLILARFQPCLDQFGVMRPEIVEDKKDLPLSILDERLKEFDQPLRAKTLLDDHPARLALIGDR